MKKILCYLNVPVDEAFAERCRKVFDDGDVRFISFSGSEKRNSIANELASIMKDSCWDEIVIEQNNASLAKELCALGIKPLCFYSADADGKCGVHRIHSVTIEMEEEILFSPEEEARRRVKGQELVERFRISCEENGMSLDQTTMLVDLLKIFVG